MWLGVDRNTGAPRIASLAVSCWLQGAPCAQPLMWNTAASVKNLGTLTVMNRIGNGCIFSFPAGGFNVNLNCSVFLWWKVYSSKPGVGKLWPTSQREKKEKLFFPVESQVISAEGMMGVGGITIL